LEPQGEGEEPEELVKEAEEEHAQVKTLLAELEGMSPEDEYFDAKVTVVIDNVRHHAEEEEEEMFPKVREAMGRNELQDLGQRMKDAKEKAPKLPSEG
jgi:hemerythrin superfamily protein